MQDDVLEIALDVGDFGTPASEPRFGLRVGAGQGVAHRKQGRVSLDDVHFQRSAALGGCEKFTVEQTVAFEDDRRRPRQRT